jgi:DNA-binding winged helix-turn-helix (wHTH) protein
MRLRFGDCTLDPDTRELFRRDRPVHLPPKAFHLLEILLAARPRAIAKEELHRLLWPGTYVSEANLATLVSHVREAIGEAGREARLLRTVHGYGYAFSGEVAEENVAPAPHSVFRLFHGKREIPLAEGENVLGRDAAVAVHIDDATISRRHARVTVAAAGASIEDLGSKNGTFVDGRRVGKSSVSLADGAEIQLGSVVVSFRGPRSSESTKTVSSSGEKSGKRRTRTA